MLSILTSQFGLGALCSQYALAFERLKQESFDVGCTYMDPYTIDFPPGAVREIVDLTDLIGAAIAGFMERPTAGFADSDGGECD